MGDTRVALVTGGGSGIGFATAQRLLRQGWLVALLDRDGAALERAAGELGGTGVIVCPVDVVDEAAVEAAVARAARAGPIRGLVNAAGIAADTPLIETTPELFRKILDVNVVGSFLTVQKAAPHMQRAGGGAIVNITSVSGLRGNLGRTAYGASKGAVVTMTQVMAVELAGMGIRVNAVAPGPVDTPMVQTMHGTTERSAWIERVPMHRYASPDEIAAGIGYLLDEELSSFVTGHVLAIDGGFLACGTVRNREAAS